jgi:hypothetical protein
MIAQIYHQLLPALPPHGVHDCIPCGNYAILIIELREDQDTTAPDGWLWEITDRSLLMDYAAGSIGIPGCTGYQKALEVAQQVLSAISHRERR